MIWTGTLRRPVTLHFSLVSSIVEDGTVAKSSSPTARSINDKPLILAFLRPVTLRSAHFEEWCRPVLGRF
jgi:hypothetical protein